MYEIVPFMSHGSPLPATIYSHRLKQEADNHHGHGHPAKKDIKDFRA